MSIKMIRGCGTRQAGGIYVETVMSPFGMPLEYFMVDPTTPYEGVIRKVGVEPVEIGGVTHILDYVGTKFYPNAADFIEEARVMGASRRMPRAFDFARITPESRIILVHEKAWFAEKADGSGHVRCPKDMPEGHGKGTFCLGNVWDDVDGAVEGKRTLPCGKVYEGQKVEMKRTYRPAVFLSLPVGRVVVVKGDGAVESMSRAMEAKVDVAMVEE